MCEKTMTFACLASGLLFAVFTTTDPLSFHHGPMLRFIKSLFRKNKSAPAVAASSPAAATAATGRGAHGASEVNTPVPRVETAQLSLLAVMSRFPDDLRKLVLKMPPQEAMVVLPIPTIQKMLPTGSVKMSLASVVRQAPPGTFSTINPQDKRLVEVPLAEIFKRINPALLKKRADQKQSDLAADGFDIFGDEENPHALAPKVEGVAAPAQAAPAPTLGAPGKVLKTSPGMVAAPPASVPAPATAKPAPAPLPKPNLPTPTAQPKVAAKAPAAPAAPTAAPTKAGGKPAAKPAAPAPAPAAASADDGQPPLIIALKDLFGAWPEPIKTEAAANNGSNISLPAAEVGAGLAKGKVAFTWGQIRAWSNPPLEGGTEAPESTELVLPLRTMAPAFMKHSKGAGTARKAGEVGDIPELFAGGKTSKRNVPAPAPAPAPEAKAPEPEPEAKAPEPAPVAEPEAKAPEPEVEKVEAPEPEKAAEPEAKAPEAAEPAAEKAPEAEVPTTEPAAVEGAAQEEPAKAEEPEASAADGEEKPAAEAPAEEAAAAKAEEPATAEPAVPAKASAPVAPPAAPAAAVVLPKTLGELFGQPEKTSWSPSEVVNHLCDLPDVAGAVVALQEGLVIAHKLPDSLKGDIFAAFLPQIFARLNQYCGEMKLGGVNEISVVTEAGPCHLFRRGQVFFAAVSKPDAALPLHNLRLCADAVAS